MASTPNNTPTKQATDNNNVFFMIDYLQYRVNLRNIAASARFHANTQITSKIHLLSFAFDCAGAGAHWGHGAVKQKEISNYFVLGACSKLKNQSKKFYV